MSDNSQKIPDYQFKILLLGDSSVGKTCFFLRFTDDYFNENYLSTIGMDTVSIDITHQDKTTYEEKLIRLTITDTAGQDRFRSIVSSYYRGSNGLLLLFDITNKDTFNHVNDWISQIHSHVNKNEVKIILVGNKIDLQSKREVTFEEAKALADSHRIPYMEASAKDNINVESIFKEITNLVYTSQKGKKHDTENRTLVGKYKKRKQCCE